MGQLPINEILMQISMAVGFVWYLAKEHSLIYTRIDELKDDLVDKIRSQESKINLHVQQSNHNFMNLSERVSGQGKRFGSKFNRIENLLDNTITLNRIEGKIDKLNNEE